LNVPELLSPAGDWAAMQAAVASGADAVYFGVDAFNARQRAENFRLDDLPEVMQWLHQRDVKGFLTFNVLVFSDELEAAAQLLIAADEAAVDAVIVQDVGLCWLAQRLVPNLCVHGSTQMSITSSAGIAQAAALGCQRVVLARELTLRDLERLQAQLAQRNLVMPLEVFVHGALCVAYSGQCLTSESLGQRSANRGECAQACRLPYEMVVDGEPHALEDQRYLLSPQDLAAWELLPELQRIGVASLKIEGRLKDAAYVAAVTDAYRQRLDQTPVSAPQVQRQLELAFSRGLATGWLQGVNHRRLVHGRWSKKRGPLLGQLLRVERGGWLHLRTREQLQPGQGLVLEQHSSDPLQPPREIGGRIMVCERMGAERWKLRLGPDRADLSGLSPGASVWLTSDPDWQSRWQRAARRTVEARSRDLALRVSGRLDAPLELQLLAPQGLDLKLSSMMPLQQATQRPLDRERLQEQLGRLGGTGWSLESLEIQLEGDLFLPVAELNRMRRALLELLEASLDDTSGSASIPAASEGADAMQLLDRMSTQSLEPQSETSPGLVVLVRSLEQLQTLVNLSDEGLPVQSVVADLEQPRELREAVAMGRGCWPDGLWLAGARITRPDERWSLEPLIRARPDGFLVRNADQLEVLTPLAPCIGDFSLNTANPLSFYWYRDHWKLQRITASYDLNLQQLLDLAAAVDPALLEVTLHQHMPLFHMEHCLFCAFLSDGKDHTDCGRPCEKHHVTLRDRSGVDHPLRADLGCRNTLFNGTAQSGVEALPSLLRAGVRRIRLELLDEDAAATRRRISLYSEAMAGRMATQDVWSQERIHHQLGVTRGSLRIKGPERTSRFSR
jgi:putative protease